MESNITKEVVFSYFAGTCTALQKKLIEEWVKQGANKELFFSWLYEWEKKNAQYNADPDAGLERHRKWVASLEEPAPVSAFEQRPVRKLLSPRLVAAACALLIALLAGWFAKDLILYHTHETAFGEIKKMTLDDGSKVVLNANSTLRVPRFGFGKKIRRVFLTGEASFDVVHTSSHTRFVVQTDKDLNVEVLGTEFDVYSRPSGSRVVLNTGRVELHYSDGNKNQKLTLKPGDLVSMDRKGKVTRAHTAQPQNFSAWKYHRFVFEDQPFREICDRLEETFGTKIVIRDQNLSSQIISGSFTALDAEELLDLLGQAGQFSYVNKKGQITIYSDATSDTAPEKQAE